MAGGMEDELFGKGFALDCDDEFVPLGCVLVARGVKGGSWKAPGLIELDTCGRPFALKPVSSYAPHGFSWAVLRPLHCDPLDLSKLVGSFPATGSTGGGVGVVDVQVGCGVGVCVVVVGGVGDIPI